MTVNKPLFLTGLARDVIEHGECKSCKVNAAMGLAALGLLDEFLARKGLPDPRPPDVPFSPTHAGVPVPRPADPDVVYEFRLRVVAPEGMTQDDADRLLEQLMADFGTAVVARGAHLDDASRRGVRPRQPNP